MFISVLLPAPFSPSRAWTSPRREVEVDVVVGDDAGEALDDAAHLDGEHGVAGAARAAAGHGGGDGARRARPRRACHLAASSSLDLVAEFGQLGLDPLGPPVHAGRALVAGRAGRELVEIGLHELLAGGEDLVARVVLDRPGEDVEAG